MRFDLRHLLSRLAAGALATLFASACVTKGDTSIDVEQDGGSGPPPTCVNVCGRITANEPEWLPCLKVAVKDREGCLARCQAINPSEDALRCAMKSFDCAELAMCPDVY